MKKIVMMVLGMLVSAAVLQMATAEAGMFNNRRNNVSPCGPCVPACGPAVVTPQAGGGNTADNRSRATEQEYVEATSLVIAKHYQSSELRQGWQAMKSQYLFDPAFAKAVEQVISNPNALRNFARIQERFTGNPINID